MAGYFGVDIGFLLTLTTTERKIAKASKVPVTSGSRVGAGDAVKEVSLLYLLEKAWLQCSLMRVKGLD